MSIDTGSLWEALPEDGSTIGNQRARSELGWKSVQRFEAAKTLLVATGEIALGRGRGGSIRRKLQVASTPDVPKPPAASLDERPRPKKPARATKSLEPRSGTRRTSSAARWTPPKTIFLKYVSDSFMMRLDELATFAANLHPPAAEHITAAVSDALSGTASHPMTHLEAG